MRLTLKDKVRLVAGLCVSGIFMFLAVRGVQWSLVGEVLTEMNPLWLVGGVSLFICVYMMAAVRWTWLFIDGHRPSIKIAFRYIMIGYLLNTFLPVRMGDIGRGVLFARRADQPLAVVFSTLYIERLLDVLVLGALAGLVFLCIPVPVVIRNGIGLLVGGAISSLLILIVVAAIMKKLRHVPQKIPGRKMFVKLAKLVHKFAAAAEIWKRPMNFGVAVILSVLIWFGVGAGMYIWLKAFDINVPWYTGWFLAVVVNLGAAIPSSPGFVGVYHYLVVLALSVMAVPRQVALAYALSTHVLILIVYILLGGLSLLFEGLHAVDVIGMVEKEGQHE